MTYSPGEWSLYADYAVPWDCNSLIIPNGEACTILIEDLAGNMPSQTIHIITVP
jgi:hypothetical protein